MKEAENIQRLRPDELRTDGGTQMREKISEPTVAEYAALMRDGTDFPPVVAFFDGKDYWLADGFHRLEAQIANERKAIKVDVREGTRRDAVLFSISANATHGLPRKHGDKRRAVETLLRDTEWGKWSNASVASRAGVSTIYVTNIRQRLLRSGEIEAGATVTYTMRGKVCERPSTYGATHAANRGLNFNRDWIALLANFTTEQFEEWKAAMHDRPKDKTTAVDAVTMIYRDAESKAKLKVVPSNSMPLTA